MKKNILLVQPEWPIPSRKKHSIHHKYFPIGLLKMSTLFKSQGHNVEFVIGVQNTLNMVPDEIYITSLFTYWARFVMETAKGYRKIYPRARIIIGGPFVTLMNFFDPAYLDLMKTFSGIDEFFIGLYNEAEDCLPDLSLIPYTNLSAIHGSRGCIRRCSPCGVPLIEKNFTYKSHIEKEIITNSVVVYDNNFFANPHAESLLEQMAGARVNGRVIQYEAQSGLDARLLVKKPHLAKMLKAARFHRPRIAWDNALEEYAIVEEAIRLLQEAGYANKVIMVFVIYNFEQPFDVMEIKRKTLAKLGIQISDCRYRPLDSLEDKYNPRKPQSPDDYYIHTTAGWTDDLVKEYRRRIRGQNIMVRFLTQNRPFDDKFYDIFSKNNVPDVVIEDFRLMSGQGLRQVS